MSTITIDDLPLNRALDIRAMSSIHGAGGAPWVFGAFRPHMEQVPGAVAPSVLNFYQTTNNIFAQQVINNSQEININNSGNNANLNAVLVNAISAA